MSVWHLKMWRILSNKEAPRHWSRRMRIAADRAASLYPKYDEDDTAFECYFCKKRVEWTNLKCKKCNVELCQRCFVNWSILHLKGQRKYHILRSDDHPRYNHSPLDYLAYMADEDDMVALSNHCYREGVPFYYEYELKQFDRYVFFGDYSYYFESFYADNGFAYGRLQDCWIHKPIKYLERAVVLPEEYKQFWKKHPDNDKQYLFDGSLVKTPTDIYRKIHSFKFKYVLDEFMYSPPEHLPFQAFKEKEGAVFRQTQDNFHQNEKIQ